MDRVYSACSHGGDKKQERRDEIKSKGASESVKGYLCVYIDESC